MSPVKPQEVLAHATQLWRRQPPTRSVAQIQVPYHPHRGGPQAGPDDRYPELDGAGGSSPADTDREAEERRWAAAAPACHCGCHAADGHPQAHLPGGGGSDPLLRPRPLPVWAHRDGMDAGLHHDPGLHRADGRAGDQAAESARGGAGGGKEAGGPQDCGRRHHGAGSGDPSSERDGADGQLPELGGRRQPQGRPSGGGIRGEECHCSSGRPGRRCESIGCSPRPRRRRPG